MSRFRPFALAALLLLPAAAASAYDDGLTNGPDGTVPNTPGSALGFNGINAIAPERELLYHPDRAGAPAAYQAEPDPRDGVALAAPEVPHRHGRHHRRHR